MLFAHVFDTKIVHYKRKADWTTDMGPQSGYKLGLEVAMLVQSLFKQLIGYDAGLRQSIHTSDGF